MSGPENLRAAIEHAHTDKTSLRHRRGQPRREDFTTYQEWIKAWYGWRAVKRDSELNDEERAAKFTVVEAYVRRRLGLPPGEEQP